MRKWLLRILYAVLALTPAAVWADYTATQGAGSTVFAFVCFTTKICPAHTNVNSAGSEIFTTSAPGQIQVGDGTNQVPIKAGSTAAAAADKSFVTNESPNSQLSTTIGTTSDAAGANTVMGQVKQVVANTGAALPPQSVGVPVGGFGLCDGANGSTNPCTTVATVKAASATPTSSDKPLVVVPSPQGADPCASAAKTNVAISMQNTTTIKLVSLASSQKIYICSLSLIASGTTTFSIVDGTKVTTECDTAAEAVIGTTTSSHGLALVANAGMTFGNGGSTVALTNTAAHDLCLFQSGAVDLSGNLTYVQRAP